MFLKHYFLSGISRGFPKCEKLDLNIEHKKIIRKSIIKCIYFNHCTILVQGCARIHGAKIALYFDN